MLEQRPERQQMSASFPAKLRLHQSHLLRACGRPSESDGDTGPAITLLLACPELDQRSLLRTSSPANRISCPGRSVTMDCV
jgi:hypothetical protein